MVPYSLHGRDLKRQFKYFAPDFRVGRWLPSRVDPALCAKCKGSRRLCGRPVCPIAKRIFEGSKVAPLLGRSELQAATPPSALVGEYGYPVVRLGPIAAPVQGEGAARYEDYKGWWGQLGLEDIIALRASTVYSRFELRVKEARESGSKLLEATREAALSVKPVDAEFRYAKPPRPRLTFDGIITPVGLGGMLRELKVVENPVVPRRVDQLVEDWDAKARDAAFELYRAGADNYYISRLLSLGMLGERARRRFVPTRWAITAVDKMLGDMLLGKVKTFPEYPALEVRYAEYLGNRYLLVLVPGPWTFELLEVWLPRSVWVRSTEPYISVNYELFDGKARNPEVDGGYYAIRLPVLEYLSRVGKQATIVAVREVTPSYYAPVGSWQIRESVRHALSSPPVALPQDANELLREISSRLETSVEKLLAWSRVLKRLFRPDSKLDAFVSKPR